MVGTSVRSARRAAVLCGLVASIAGACDASSDDAQAGRDAARGDIAVEAADFMSTYARDLLAGDRAAIAARYDSDGTYMVGNGRKQLLSHDSISAIYRGAWTPPASFEWRDLSYEPVGNDAVMVVGRFAWGMAAESPPIIVSYTSLLRRREGGLRIRLEDESVDPATVPAQAPADSVR